MFGNFFIIVVKAVAMCTRLPQLEVIGNFCSYIDEKTTVSGTARAYSSVCLCEAPAWRDHTPTDQ